MKASSFIIFRKKRESARKAAKPGNTLKVLGLSLLALFLLAGTGLGIRYALFSQTLPSLGLFRAYYTAKVEPTRFYARDGQTLLFTLAYDNFESHDLTICETDGKGCFPAKFTEAARIAREAAGNQNGINSIAEEMVRKVYAEDIAASLKPDLLIGILTRQVLNVYGSGQVLGWYYNTAWFGQMAFGLDAASRLYLDKPGDELSDAECVLMSAIINSPMLNPIDSRGALRDSYLQQLALLHQTGLFTDEEAEALSRNNFVIFEPPHYLGESQPDIITRKALDAVLNRYGREQVERGGLNVVTSEDPGLQRFFECLISERTDEEKASACPLSSAYDESVMERVSVSLRTAPVSAALIDVETGELLAALEGKVTPDNQRVYANSLDSYPIGSTMNIFAALTAFSSGDSPSTLLWDLENSYKSEITAADNAEPYHGPVSLREAFTGDYLRPLTMHLSSFGSGAIQRNAALFGLTNSHTVSEADILYDGSTDTAESVAFSLVPFSTLGDQTGSDASGGMHPVTVISIEKDGGQVETPQPIVQKPLIAGNLAYLVHHVFSQNTEGLKLSDRPAAVKTGNVRGADSLWISGYTTQISCSLRVGNPQITSAFVEDTDRVHETAEILWRSVMEFAHRDLPAAGWDAPAEISQVRICLPSGKLPTSACRETETEVFLRGNEPYEYDEYYQAVQINRENRMLATRFTPQENVETAVFLNLPSEAAEWAAANGIESMPAEYDPIRDEERQSPAIRIESPAEFASFSQNGGKTIDVIIRLNLTRQPESVQVSIGPGMYPTQWTEVSSSGTLSNGRWMLCSIDPASLNPGIYALRIGFTLPDQGYRSAETYFEVE